MRTIVGFLLVLLCSTCGLLSEGFAHLPKEAVTTRTLVASQTQDDCLLVAGMLLSMPFGLVRDWASTPHKFEIISPGTKIVIESLSKEDRGAVPIHISATQKLWVDLDQLMYACVWAD